MRYFMGKKVKKEIKQQIRYQVKHMKEVVPFLIQKLMASLHFKCRH